MNADQEPPAVRWPHALRFWAWLGCVSFGGPAAQIATMHDELVVRRRWLTQERFDHALGFCTLLPGPEAQQLAAYSGWLLHGARGGLAAGILFVLPGALLLLLLAWIYVAFGTVPAVAAVLWGAKAIVVALVGQALVRVGRRALRTPWHALLALLAFAAALTATVPFPWVVVAAALAGTWLPGQAANASAVLPPHPAATWRRTLRVLAIGLALWWLPLSLLTGDRTVLAREQFVFFSTTAVVTFGGAYAVLAHVLDAAAGPLGWLTPTQAIDGLALAETTPGPLLLVLEFVAFVSGHQHPGPLLPVGAALLSAAVALWATFVPALLFVFLGAPWIETLRGNRIAARMLAGITAAVFGVLAHLAIAIARAVLWPIHGTERVFDLHAALLAAPALALLLTRKFPVLVLVGIGAGVGLLRHLLTVLR
ncbi:MAG: chromate efflux transporter [Planctomycetes bacterium]|nr:chromate efflux transporter [Planctomycetota bacterium]